MAPSGLCIYTNKHTSTYLYILSHTNECNRSREMGFLHMPTNIARLENMNLPNTCQHCLESFSNPFLSDQPTPITMETGCLASF